MFAAVFVTLLAGYAVAPTLAGVALLFAFGGALFGRIRSRRSGVPAKPRIRDHHKPDADRGAPVRDDGRDAATHAHRRDAAPEPVGPDGFRPRRSRHGGHRGRHADGGEYRHRRRHGGHHGAHFSTGDAAQRLRQQACHRHHLRDRHPRPDHSAFHRPGAARRRVVERLPAGAIDAGRALAKNRFGRRSVRRRAAARTRPGRHVPGLYRGRGVHQSAPRAPAQTRTSQRIPRECPTRAGTCFSDSCRRWPS